MGHTTRQTVCCEYSQVSQLTNSVEGQLDPISLGEQSLVRSIASRPNFALAYAAISRVAAPDYAISNQERSIRIGVTICSSRRN
jgi:hypothetical protein